MPVQSFSFHQDPGHGWAKVPRELVSQLGISANISSYSYQRGEHVYLEEDCDLQVFSSAYAARFGVAPKFVSRHSNSRSRIRSYESYSQEVVI